MSLSDASLQIRMQFCNFALLMFHSQLQILVVLLFRTICFDSVVLESLLSVQIT